MMTIFYYNNITYKINVILIIVHILILMHIHIPIQVSYSDMKIHIKEGIKDLMRSKSRIGSSWLKLIENIL